MAGSWKLEVFKLGLYVTFPVALFYIFNQPQYFEDYVRKTRLERYPPGDEERRKRFREAVENRRRLMEEKELLKKLENLK